MFTKHGRSGSATQQLRVSFNSMLLNALHITSYNLLELLDGGQPKGHIGAGRREHHVLGIELNTLYGSRMVAVQCAHLETVVRVPDVHATVGAAGEYELRVGTERGLDRYALVVEMT